MKKSIILLSTALLVLGCSTDIAFEETANQEVNLNTIVQPESARALSQFDNDAKGIYRGVLATEDISYHGELTVNLGNDGNYNAMLLLTNGTKMGFVLDQEISKETGIYSMTGPHGSFTINVTEPHSPVMSNVIIAGIAADAVLLKENSASRMQTRMGTYVDSNNASNFGTWDTMSNTTEDVVVDVIAFGFPTTITVPVNVVSSLAVMKNGGGTYTDASMETFDPVDYPDCLSLGTLPPGVTATFPAGSRAPFFSDVDQVISTPAGNITINLFVVPEQSSLFGAINTNWNFIFTNQGANQYADDTCAPAATATWSTATGANGTAVKI